MRVFFLVRILCLILFFLPHAFAQQEQDTVVQKTKKIKDLRQKSKNSSVFLWYKEIDFDKTFSVLDKSAMRTQLNLLRDVEHALSAMDCKVLLQPEAALPDLKQIKLIKKINQQKRKQFALEQKRLELDSIRNSLIEEGKKKAEEALVEKKEKDSSNPVNTAPSSSDNTFKEFEIKDAEELRRPDTDYLIEIFYTLHRINNVYTHLGSNYIENDWIINKNLQEDYLCLTLNVQIFDKSRTLVAEYKADFSHKPKRLDIVTEDFLQLFLEKKEQIKEQLNTKI